MSPRESKQSICCDLPNSQFGVDHAYDTRQHLEALNGGSEVPISVQRPAAELAMAARGILSQVDARVIDSLPHIAVPVLVIIGDGDSDFLQGSNYMASRIPGAINVVVPGGGHGINVDQPEAVNNALGEFLAGL